jgi:hypothetical protein
MRASRVKSRPTIDSGYVLITVAASLLMLFGIAAYVVDLSAIRLDRAADQRITDAAASAGALATFEAGAVEGCMDALAYVAINTAGIGSLDDSGCTATFSTSCLPGSARELPLSTDRWQVTIVNPVPDGHALMNPGQIGASGYGAAGDDGDPCDRFGVQMTATHTSNFAQVIGSDQGSTTVHSVARAELPPPDGVPINVLVLDRHGCGTVKASGRGGIIVDAIYNPEDNIVEPGTLAADSDAENCDLDPDPAVLIVEGEHALMRADGPECEPNLGSEPFGSLTKWLGCGLIQVVAQGTPGCNTPACAGSGSGPNNPTPEPTSLPDPLTRAPIDHRYNCRSDYSTVPASVEWAASALTDGNEQSIPGCLTGGPAAIHNLIAGIGESGSPMTMDFGPWNQWSPTYECDIPSSHAPIVENGNWWINCPEFNVRVDVTINGNVVFKGDVNVTAGASAPHLRINNSSAGVGFAFLRDGILAKDASASLTLQNTMVYASKTSGIYMDGNDSGVLNWVAPDVDTHPFDDLALWSDAENQANIHYWAGQATLNMEGVFFVPIVSVEYAGKGTQKQTSAQFIADRLHARGQGQLVVAPVFGRAVGFRPPPFTVLIR